MFNQLFETTVIGNGDSRAFQFIAIPTSQMDLKLRALFEPPNTAIWQSDQVYQEIGIEVSNGLHFPSADPTHSIKPNMQLLPYMLAAIGTHPVGDEALKYFNKVKFEGYRVAPNQDHAFLQLTTELVTAAVVPITQSPLSLTSLTEIIRGSGVGIGATVGFLVAWGTPFLFIAVPAGMLICGATAGVSKAMEKGLERKLSAWLGARK